MPERPVIHRQTLGGAVLLTIPEPSVPVVRFSLVLRQGALADPAGQAGVTRVMLELLLRGTRRRGRVEWNRALERLGSQVGVTVATDLALLHGITLKRNLAATLELVGEALGEPAFAAAEREGLVEELVEYLRSERDDDEALVDLFWRRALYPGHPMQRRPAGETAELLVLGEPDIRASYAARWRGGDLVVALAGDVTPEEARACMAPLVGRFPVEPVPAAPLPPLPEPAGLQLLIVDKPERTQVQASLGRSAAAGTDPDVYAFWLGVTAFGGTFTSRFTREVRDVRGWSYIAQTEFARRRGYRGPLAMRTAPALEDAAACVELEVQLYRELAQGTLDEGAVDFARAYLLNRYPLEIATAADLLLPAVRNELLGYPPEELFCVPERLTAVEVDEVRAALRRHLDPERLVAVLVATAETLVPELERRFPGARLEVVDYREGLSDLGGAT